VRESVGAREPLPVDGTTSDVPSGNGSQQGRLELGGVRVDAFSTTDVREILGPLDTPGSCRHVITVNVDYMRRAARDERLRTIISEASLAVPDGRPVAWLMKAARGVSSVRVTGHDLTDGLLEMSAADGFSVFFLGGSPEVGKQAAENARRKFPGVSIAGIYSPPHMPYPFEEEENRRIVEMINDSGASAALVALGCPKQDYWISDHLGELEASVAIGVGCVFDIMAGLVTRAPRKIQAIGLEWLYRLYQEPRRLAGRYGSDGAFIASLTAREVVRGRVRGAA